MNNLLVTMHSASVVEEFTLCYYVCPNALSVVVWERLVTPVSTAWCDVDVSWNAASPCGNSMWDDAILIF